MHKQANQAELIKLISNYWNNGDIQRAWLEIYHYTKHDWVKHVIDSLELPPLEPVHRVSIKERAKQIREELDQKVLDIEIPSKLISLDELKTNLDTLYQELDSRDHSLVPWLAQTVESLLAKEVDESPLTVAILGEFSSGKSRLINALLGDNILSVGLVPVTRSVTKIRYGQNKTVTVKYVNQDIKSVPLEQLRTYIDERKKSDISEAEIKEVIIHFPADVLKRIEIWDTPGFNSNNELHDQVATQLLNEADVVVWAMAAHQIGSKSESKLLKIAEKLKGRVLAVLNQVDRIGNIEAINEQVKEALNHYKNYVTGVIPTSAKWIEQGEANGNLLSFIEALQQIGKWNRELKQESFKRTLIATSHKLHAYFSIKSEENKQRQAAYQTYKKEYKELNESWVEVERHCMLIHKVSPRVRNDEYLDQYFHHIAQYPRLTKMYVAVDQAESKQEFISVFHAIYNLEHAFWNIGPKENPTPWKQDYISHIQMAISLDESQRHSGLFFSVTWPSFFITQIHHSHEIRILNRYSMGMSRNGTEINVVDMHIHFYFLTNKLKKSYDSNHHLTDNEVKQILKRLDELKSIEQLNHINIHIDDPQGLILKTREMLDRISDLKLAYKRHDELSKSMEDFERYVKNLNISSNYSSDFNGDAAGGAAALAGLIFLLAGVVEFGFLMCFIFLMAYFTIVYFGNLTGKYLASQKYKEINKWKS